MSTGKTLIALFVFFTAAQAAGCQWFSSAPVPADGDVDADARPDWMTDGPFDLPGDFEWDQSSCATDFQAPGIVSGPDVTTTATTALITWTTDEPSTSFAEYGTRADYGATSGSADFVIEHAVQLTGLAPGTEFNYRVRSSDPCGNETLSGNATFTTGEEADMQAPTLVDEPDAVTNGPYTVTLEWSAVSSLDGDAVQYGAEIAREPGFTTVVYSSGWIPGTAWTVTVDAGYSYYWRAQARDALHTTIDSPWSSIDIFTITLSGTPPAPVLIDEPDYTSYGADTPVTLDWGASTDPEGDPVDYQVQVDDSSDFSSPDFESGWAPDRSFTITVAPRGTWYWRAQARDAAHPAGISPWSSVDSFSDLWSNAPPAPGLVDEPDYDSGGSNMVITFDWYGVSDPDGDPVDYYVQVDNAGDFSSPDYTSGWIPGTSWSVTVPPGTAWSWRVQARDAAHTANTSPWSAVDTFADTWSNAPPAPTLIPQPDYDSGGGDVVITLAWNAVADPDGDPVQYYVQIDDIADFSHVYAVSDWIPGTSWAITLPYGYWWYWRVMARDAAHPAYTSGWSAADDFYDTWTSSSCPFLYVWNGKEYTYLTDIKGSVIGLPDYIPLMKHVDLFGPVYVVLDGLKKDEKGRYRLKIRESLPEITYVDEIKLLIVDHPRGNEIASSTAEYTADYGYSTPFRVITTRSPRPLLSATDKEGRDITSTLQAIDGRHAPMDTNALEYYTLDFGKVEDPSNARLVIEGWSMYGHRYATTTYVQPYIEVADGGGRWVKVKSFGNISGDFKRMVVDIPGIFLGSDHRIRIHMGMEANARWVIDRIMFDDSPQVPVAATEVEPLSAVLGHKGRATHILASVLGRLLAKDDSNPEYPGALSTGRFTRYGSVMKLIARTDDMFAIMRHGDEMKLRFPDLPPPAQGMARGLMLKANLYYKAYYASTDVDPLPFKGMKSYPPAGGTSYPSDKEHKIYLKTYNTRIFKTIPAAKPAK